MSTPRSSRPSAAPACRWSEPSRSAPPAISAPAPRSRSRNPRSRNQGADMPQYFSPGVYVEEIDAGPRPIQGVGTSIAGMVGVTVRGPTAGKPQLVTSFLDYQRRFGGFLPDPEEALRNRWQDSAAANVEGGRWWLLPHAVRAFFDNGGQQLYVKRGAARGGPPPRAALPGGAAPPAPPE